MKKIAVVSVFLFVVMGFAGGVQALTWNTHTNYVSWLNAIDTNNLVSENFEDATLEPGMSITEVGGAGAIHYGVYENIVDKDANRFQVFNMAPAMYAWGAWLDLKNPGGAGTSIDVYINDTNQLVFNVPNTVEGAFVGFVVTDGSFTGVRFEDGLGSGIQETYYSVDMAFARNPVPIPAAFWLLGSGLLGLVGLRRKFKK